MGRTGRKRLHKPQERPTTLNHEINVINLRKFMSRMDFRDELNLQLRDFPHTGRGVSTSQPLHENDVLITVPFDLMISYVTLKSENFMNLFTPHGSLTIHDLLACFLVFERHKTESFWKHYINTIPPEPPWLPALLSEEHIELLPVDLRLAAKKSRRLLRQSWARIRGSIKRDWRCSCCGKKADCLMELSSFIWGFILVNTRAIYVSPSIIRDFCQWTDDGLSDEPCMALCPFLDMFNHSDKAKTKAELICRNGKWMYQLTTLTGYKKYEQIFISYGAHDNAKLLVEYGFFIVGNSFDCEFFETEDIFNALNITVSQSLQKFIETHELDKYLFVSGTGPSFNLKAVIYICSNQGKPMKDFASVIFTDNYPRKFLENTLKQTCRDLLVWKLGCLEDSFMEFRCSEVKPLLLVNFLDYRRNFVKLLGDVFNTTIDKQ